jgi:hypothetical protein
MLDPVLNTDVEREWSALYNNAKLPKFKTKIQNKYEEEIFDNFLFKEIETFLYELDAYTELKYGKKYRCYEWGQSKNTIAPSELMKDSVEGSFGKLNTDAVDKNTIEVLMDINFLVKQEIRSIEEKYKHYKKQNKLKQEIDEHDNMKKIMIESWVTI